MFEKESFYYTKAEKVMRFLSLYQRKVTFFVNMNSLTESHGVIKLAYVFFLTCFMYWNCWRSHVPNKDLKNATYYVLGTR